MFHIGAPKTGTTAIQSFLENNRRLLESSFDISIPKLLSYRRAAAMRVYATQRASERRIEKLGVESLPQFSKKYEAQIKALENSVGTTTVICSNELLFSLDKTAIERVKRAFLLSFSSFRIVMYLRRQDLLETAAYLQAFKGGYEDLHAFRTVLKRRRLGYLAVLRSWSEVFGQENISVFLYEDIMREEGDVITHFMRVAGIDDLSSFRKATKKNSSWGFNQAWAARIIRQQCQDAPLKRIRRVVEAIESGSRYPVSRSDALAFYRTFLAENEQVRSRYFPHKETLFEEEFSMYPEVFDREAEIGKLSEIELLRQFNTV